MNFTRAAFAAAVAYRKNRSQVPEVRRIQRAMVTALFDMEPRGVDSRTVSAEELRETVKWGKFDR